jgi:DNA helicase-2/ATP-dependent DNA helicase PcrA
VVDAALQAGQQSGSPGPTGADALALRLGDDVRHATYGEGVIVDVTGQGEKAEARVRFPGIGEKTFLLAWTPLEKA